MIQMELHLQRQMILNDDPYQPLGSLQDVWVKMVLSELSCEVDNMPMLKLKAFITSGLPSDIVILSLSMTICYMNFPSGNTMQISAH